MPMNGRKVEVIASWLLSSRHCVRQIQAALTITLTTPTITVTAGQGDGVWPTGQGTGNGLANAVSIV
jgi:hypothetical protein